MKLVTYNIQYGKGRDQVYDLPRIASRVAEADIIALQEVERYFDRSGSQDQVHILSELLADHHWVFGAGVSLPAPRHGPGPASGIRRREFGNMLLSRWPVESHRSHLLPKYASRGPVSIQRTAEEAVITTPAGRFRFYSVHLTHLSTETRLPQVEKLLKIHRTAGLEGMPLTGRPAGDWYPDEKSQLMPEQAIFMGDFNCEWDSPEYQAMVGPVSEYGGRVTNPQGFVDAWVEDGNGPDTGVTAEIHGRPVRFDYIFMSTPLSERLTSVWIDNDTEASDHQPVWAELSE